MKRYTLQTLLALVVLMLSTSLWAQAFIDAEGAVAFTGYNDVRIPSKGGTDFSLADDVEADPTPVFRLRLGYTAKDRHTLIATIAPLTIKGSGTLDKDVSFGGNTFSAGEKVDTIYRFDSYRLTYRYLFVDRYFLSVAGGITGKIRSATIAVMSDSGYADRNDLGFVPLVHLMVHWKPSDKFSVLLDMDALGSPYGRAEDVLLALQYAYSESASIRLGWRLLEGGSDGGGDVYTFALINYATVGVTVAF